MNSWIQFRYISRFFVWSCDKSNWWLSYLIYVMLTLHFSEISMLTWKTWLSFYCSTLWWRIQLFYLLQGSQLIVLSFRGIFLVIVYPFNLLFSSSLVIYSVRRLIFSNLCQYGCLCRPTRSIVLISPPICWFLMMNSRRELRSLWGPRNWRNMIKAKAKVFRAARPQFRPPMRKCWLIRKFFSVSAFRMKHLVLVVCTIMLNHLFLYNII